MSQTVCPPVHRFFPHQFLCQISDEPGEVNKSTKDENTKKGQADHKTEMTAPEKDFSLFSGKQIKFFIVP